MGPISYDINVQTPFQAAMQGYQASAAIRDDRAQQEAKQIALQQQRQMATDLRALSMNPNAGAADYATMTTRYPQLSEQLTKSWNLLNDAQKQNNLNTGSQVYAAVSSGKPEVASEILNRQAAAKRNSGDEKGALQDEAMAKMIAEHPEAGKNIVGLSLSAIMGPEKFATTFSSLGEESRKQVVAPAEQAIKVAEAKIKGAEAGVAEEKQAVDIAEKRDQIAERARRFGLDQDKLTSEVQMKLYEMRQKTGEIPEFVSKDITAATTDAMAAEQSAGRLDGLAGEIDKNAKQMGVGWKGSLDEMVKRGLMNRNEITRIRAEYNRVVTPAAMAAYKKVASGSTSDRDIDTAMVGVPKDTDDPALMASFLRGAAKLQRYDAVVNNAKSEWLGAVKNLGKAKTDIEVDGVQVPSGTTFKNFVDMYVDQKIAKQQAAKSAEAVQSRGYMKYANPQPAQPVAAPAGPDMRGVLPATGGL
jgi:hypothetical protein